MKIAYLTSHFDFGNYTNRGVGYYICECLRNNGIEVEQVGFVREPWKRLFWIKSRILELFTRKRHLRHREPRIHAATGRALSKKLAGANFDAVLAFGSLPVSYVRTDKPLIIWTDATFAGLLDYYDEYTNLTKSSVRNGNAMDQRAFDNATHIIFSSDWALRTALDNYSIEPSKTSMVTFGANLDYRFTTEEIEKFVQTRASDKCHLIANGRFWHRKGIDRAVEIARCLFRKGIKVQLDVIGCVHEIDEEAAQFVVMHGLIDKNIPSNQEKIAALFAQAHFHVLMSRFECCAHALMEAAAFGVPSVSTNTGGIPSAVIEGVNGCLFGLGSDASEAADYIEKYLNNTDEYRSLALNTFAHYSENQSWDVAGRKVKAIIEGLLSGNLQAGI